MAAARPDINEITWFKRDIAKLQTDSIIYEFQQHVGTKVISLLLDARVTRTINDGRHYRMYICNDEYLGLYTR